MTNNNQVPESAEERTVGERLRDERLKRQLTLEQVAQQLKLKAEVLASLESDEPDKAILPTFMRGYLKAYARFLKLPEQALLAQFEQRHQLKSTPVKAMRTFSNRSARQRVEKRFMWLTWFIVLILVVLLVAWFWQSARDNTLDAVSSETLEVNATLSQERVTPALAARPEEADHDLFAAQQAWLPVEPTEEAEAQSEQGDGVAVDVMVTETEIFGNTQTPGLDRLKMTFADNCWIDVLDANGDRIAFGTKAPGYVMELNARGPFVITLGNPGVVSIELNQQPYDMSRFPGNRVAKFTLSGQNE